MFVSFSVKKNQFLNSPFGIPIETPIGSNRPVKQGEVILGLYDINQQRLIDNGGSVFIGDRLFIEIKYRTGFIRNSFRNFPIFFFN